MSRGMKLRHIALTLGNDCPLKQNGSCRQRSRHCQPRGVPWDTPGGWSCHKAIYYTNETLCAERPEPVGTHPDGDTPDGISDMAGNVSEWIFDWFAEYTEESQTNPVGPDDGVYKILRGGGFRDSSDALREKDRVLANPKSRSEGVGFRCAVSSSALSNSLGGAHETLLCNSTIQCIDWL